MKYLIANWKAQMSFHDVEKWIEVFIALLHKDNELKQRLKKNELKIIICPPFPFILYVKDKLQHIQNIEIGSQTVSFQDQGKYTGEVTASSLKEYISYTLIGHSERRTKNNETESKIERQIDLSNTYHINPILCIRGIEDKIYPSVDIIAYEPVGSIATGHNEDPAKVMRMKKNLKLPEHVVFIYGGSITKDNYKDYYKEGVDGLLVGGTSLDPAEFLELTK